MQFGYQSDRVRSWASSTEKKRSGFLSFVDILETLVLSMVLFVGINIISACIRVMVIA
jgi:hypothetical protein